MTIPTNATPPFSWVDATNLEGTLLGSQQMCEAMQALTNRAEFAGVEDPAIPSWTAYRYNGDVLTTELGDIPEDDALAWYYEIATGFRFRSVSGLSDDPSVVDEINQTEYAARLPDGGPWIDGIDGQTIFVDKDDSILIGAIAEFPDLFEATFYELQVILTTPASVDAQVKFYYYTDFNTWVEFFPSDGTNGFRRNGVIIWSSAGDCPNWKSDHDPGGADGGPGYYIMITRTQDDMAVTPVPETIKLLLDPDRPVDKPGRSVKFFEDLRTALEIVLVYYLDPTGDSFTLESLMQLAVGRPGYNRSIQALRDLGYFDGEDLEEILKCIDLLINYIQIKGFVNGVEVLSYVVPDIWGRYQRHFDVDGEGNPSENRAFAFSTSTRSTVIDLIDSLGEMDFDFVSSGTNSSVQTTTSPPSQLSLDNLDTTGDTDFVDTAEITFNLKCEKTSGGPGTSGATFNLHMPPITGDKGLILSASIVLDSGTGTYSRLMQLKETEPLITLAEDIAVFGATASKDFDFKWTIGI